MDKVPASVSARIQPSCTRKGISLDNLLEMVALLETPTGFAFFNVREKLCQGPENLWSWFVAEQVSDDVICLLEFIKFDDKSIVWHSDGPGQKLSMAIWKYCGNERQLIVGDKKLRGVIKSNLDVNCFENEVVIRELMWGLRNVLYDYVYQERANLTLEYILPLCQGFKDCMRKFGINFSTEIIDRTFIAYAGALHQCDVLLKQYAKTLRETCDQLVPGIGGLLEDDLIYAEVMVKILIPRSVPEWNPFKRLPGDVVEKIKAAAASDARKKTDYETYDLIYALAVKVRNFPEQKKYLIQKLESLAGRQKRTHMEVAEGTSSEESWSDKDSSQQMEVAEGTSSEESWSDKDSSQQMGIEVDEADQHAGQQKGILREVVEVTERTSGQDEGRVGANASGLCGKKARLV